jgi:hypothetical protein
MIRKTEGDKDETKKQKGEGGFKPDTRTRHGG